MPGNQFKPIVEDDLPEVAAFLKEQQEITSREDWTQARPSGDDLRWLLKNPHLSPKMALGETLRDSQGKILGMILALPRAYRLGDRRLLGLAAGNFFVDAAARMQGFFLLRRFLATQGADFWYANSCNRQSGPLWSKCGAVMVPESDVEYLFPFRLGPLARELALRRQWPRPVAGLLRAAGPLATLAVAPRRPRNRLSLTYCADFEKLAEIAERDRDPQLLQPERSVAYLLWPYGALPLSPRDDATRLIYCFTAPSGAEGWFVLDFGRRGRDQEIRSARLVDVVWPSHQLSFLDVLPAIIDVASPRSDVLSIRGRVGMALRDGLLGLRRRTLLAPEGFLVSRSPPTGELVKLADLPFADRY
jgi:hypothetical protein